MNLYQTELLCINKKNEFIPNWIARKRTVHMYKNGFGIK